MPAACRMLARRSPRYRRAARSAHSIAFSVTTSSGAESSAHQPAAARGSGRAPAAWHRATCRAIVPKDLDQLAALATEHVEVFAMRGAFEGLLHRQGQRVHAAAHVGVAGRSVAEVSLSHAS